MTIPSIALYLFLISFGIVSGFEIKNKVAVVTVSVLAVTAGVFGLFKVKE